MSMLETILLVIHLLVAVAVCGFVLLQHGKGADMGAAFGSGASGSLFGAVGSANFLSRTTAVLATVFFLSSLALTWFATTRTGPKSVIQQGVMESIPAPKASDVPAAPAAAGGAAGGSTAEPAKAAIPAAAPVAPANAPAVNPAGSKSGDVPK